MPLHANTRGEFFLEGQRAREIPNQEDFIPRDYICIPNCTSNNYHFNYIKKLICMSSEYARPSVFCNNCLSNSHICKSQLVISANESGDKNVSSPTCKFHGVNVNNDKNSCSDIKLVEPRLVNNLPVLSVPLVPDPNNISNINRNKIRNNVHNNVGNNHAKNKSNKSPSILLVSLIKLITCYFLTFYFLLSAPLLTNSERVGDVEGKGASPKQESIKNSQKKSLNDNENYLNNNISDTNAHITQFTLADKKARHREIGGYYFYRFSDGSNSTGTGSLLVNPTSNLESQSKSNSRYEDKANNNADNVKFEVGLGDSAISAVRVNISKYIELNSKSDSFMKVKDYPTDWKILLIFNTTLFQPQRIVESISEKKKEDRIGKSIETQAKPNALIIMSDFQNQNQDVQLHGENKDEFYYDAFPPNFLWGVASSSYQTEGGWNEDGKGENIWDRFCHSDSSRIKDKSNGDIACDSYHKYGEDVKLVKELGAKSYRISISWARILPKGTTEAVNQAGIDYYNKIIDALIADGMEPMLTLYHWDLPQNLQDMGGWENEGIIGIFGDYARICFKNFGDRVKLWVTINEPYIFCMAGYDWGVFAPGIKQPAVSPYQCVHTVIKAHAMAYSIYKEQFAPSQKGKIGIACDSWWYEPADANKTEDKEAAERALQFRLGWILGPIFQGDYPPVMRKLVDSHSKLENRSESRLPFFSKEWTSKIKGSVDFIGLNHYTTELVKPADADPAHPSWSSDSETLRYYDPTWPATGSAWLKLVPWGLRKLLNWMKNEYGNAEVIITENGCSDPGNTLEDKQRSEYFTLYIDEVLKAIKLDGCNVTGYFAWSLMDVFEWDVGYTEKFGIYAVDFSSVNRTRTPKESAKTLLKIFKDNGFPKKLTLTGASEGGASASALTASSESNSASHLYCSTTVLTLALIFALLSAF